MRRYTKHLQTILQTQKIAKHKKSTHTPPKQWSMERRKMLASTIQFSHNTPTPQQPHKPHDHCRAGQQDNHNHTNTVWLTVCCPRHPTACQHTKTMFVKQSRPRSATQCIYPLRMRIHPDFKILFGGSHTLGDSTTQSHNRGHNKTKSSLERR